MLSGKLRNARMLQCLPPILHEKYAEMVVAPFMRLHDTQLVGPVVLAALALKPKAGELPT
jgi:hypothetical protein